MPKVRVDFYQVVMPDPAHLSFDDVLAKAHGLPRNDTSRNRAAPHSQGSHQIRLHALQPQQRLWEGDLIRIRMDDLPLKANLVGDTEIIPLDDDEGIGEETAFLYDSKLHVLVLQANRSGVTAGAFAYYFEQVGDVEGPIVLAPVLELDTLDRLRRLGEVRKLTIRFAGLDNVGQIFQGQDAAVQEFTNAAAQFRAPVMEVSLSVGRQRGVSLLVQKAKRAAQQLVRSADQHPNSIERIEISGTSDTGERDVIDLLRDRIREEHEVAADRDRRVDYQRRGSIIRSAYDKRRGELQRMFQQ